ncbi:MAG: radical SAM protein [Thermodesulfobacteriota bacterium]|nr:radical SAM protein [Thermodesulfobacteriota bacterium]
MGRCSGCGKESRLISNALMACAHCIRENYEKVKAPIEETHKRSRQEFSLPPLAPRDPSGQICHICFQECHIAEGKSGYCGLRINKEGKLMGGTSDQGNLFPYYDPLPTNCVADWVCPGGTGAGYPEFAYSTGPEYGYKNLAVFYNACSFNCLFCQNWQYRTRAYQEKRISPDQLADFVDEDTACICYFGGDPTPQLPHSLLMSRLALKKKRNRILRICWETNGCMDAGLLHEIVELSLESGGCVKFDLKAWNESIHLALCGASNKRTLENFKSVAHFSKKRPNPSLFIASTVLVPGYVDEEEVAGIAGFIASLNHEIPYALLGFYPHFYMKDLPTTSRTHAEKCKEVAEKEGLINVRIGNIHLLRNSY